MDEKSEKSELVELTTDVVSAYVSNNTIVPSDLPNLINEVYEALSRASAKSAKPLREDLKPAIPKNKSISDDYIICLEDGKRFKSLKRHLRTHYNLTPEEYKEKWNLPHDYPMVAPNYAKARSKLAKKMGLGQRKSSKK